MSDKKPFLYEPTTAITDYIIFLLGVFFGLATLAIQDSQFHQLWGLAFYSIGIGGFLGGTSHGFGPKLKEVYRKILWRFTLVFIAVTGLLITMSAALFFVTEKGENALYIITGVLLLTYFQRIRKKDSFRSAVTFYMPLMGISLVGFAMAFYFQNMTGALSITVGLLVCVAGTVVQVMKISVHEKFNHNDLFHVIQMLGMFFMYRGGLEIHPF